MDKEKIIKSNKADRHLHGGLGCSLDSFRKICEYNVMSPPAKMFTLKEMNNYIRLNIINQFCKPYIFEKTIKAALEEAANDGVSIIEMSIDYHASNYFVEKQNGLADFLNKLVCDFSSKIDFRPELGINRAADIKETYDNAIKCISTGVFKSIDLYGEEDAQKISKFQILFKEAKKNGLKLKAHVGEFGDANSVLEAVDVLNLDEVQHGIAAAKSEYVIKYLIERGTRLNICPTSNITLDIIRNIKLHPIRKLFDKGVRVSVNTDDILIFGQSLSDEYFNLFKAGLFSENEIATLMENSLFDY